MNKPLLGAAGLAVTAVMTIATGGASYAACGQPATPAVTKTVHHPAVVKHHDAVAATTHQEWRWIRTVHHSHLEYKYGHHQYRWPILSREEIPQSHPEYQWTVQTREVEHHSHTEYRWPVQVLVPSTPAVTHEEYRWQIQTRAVLSPKHTEWKYAQHGGNGVMWVKNDTYKYVDAEGHGTDEKPEDGVTYYERTQKTRTVEARYGDWQDSGHTDWSRSDSAPADTDTTRYVQGDSRTVTDQPAQDSYWKDDGYTQWSTSSDQPTESAKRYGQVETRSVQDPDTYGAWMTTGKTDWGTSSTPPQDSVERHPG